MSDKGSDSPGKGSGMRLLKFSADDGGRISSGEIVAFLEGVLADAKAGELTGVAVVTQRSNGNVGSAFCTVHGGSYFTLAGGLSWLQGRLLNEARDI